MNQIIAFVSPDGSAPLQIVVSRDNPLPVYAVGGGGGGAVDSVNGQTGVVVLDAADVGAVSTVAGTADEVLVNGGTAPATGAVVLSLASPLMFEPGSGFGSVQLKGTKYLGQITLTNGSANIVGVGTDFTNAGDAGLATWEELQVIDSAGNFYFVAIDTITDDTHATISEVYPDGAYEGTPSATWPGVSGTYDFYLFLSNASGLGSAALNGTASGVNSLASGYGAVASGGTSCAMGYTAVARSAGGLSIGLGALVTGALSSAVGFQVKTTATSSASFGQGFTNDVDGSVALGSGSVFLRALATGTTIVGAFTSGDPNGGTAAPWKLGSYASGLVELDISGTLYNLLTTGYVNPVNSQSADYGLVAADAGKSILHPSTDANDRTFTIPAYGTTPIPVGAVIPIINDSANNVTIAITSDTLIQAGTGSTGSRTLLPNGRAVLFHMTTTRWQIDGTNIT